MKFEQDKRPRKTKLLLPLAPARIAQQLGPQRATRRDSAGRLQGSTAPAVAPLFIRAAAAMSGEPRIAAHSHSPASRQSKAAPALPMAALFEFETAPQTAAQAALPLTASPVPQSAGTSSSARDMAVRARSASRQLQVMSTEERVAMLHRVADALLANEKVRQAVEGAACLQPAAAAWQGRRSGQPPSSSSTQPREPPSDAGDPGGQRCRHRRAHGPHQRHAAAAPGAEACQAGAAGRGHQGHRSAGGAGGPAAQPAGGQRG